MGLTLELVELLPKGSPLANLIATYKVAHHGEKTTLDLDLSLVVGPDGTHVHMVIEGPDCATPEQAFDRFAEWLERTAEAVRNRGAALSSLPLYKGTR